MDVALKWDGISADIGFTETDLASEKGLETSVIISLFTDRRVGKERGFWADTFEDEPMGSRLWLLDREKKTSDVVLRANEYVREALSWMLKDGIAKTISVDSYIEGNDRIVIPIKIIRPSNEELNFKFSSLWESMKS